MESLRIYLAILASLILLGGCASPRTDASQNSLSAISNVREHIPKLKLQVDAIDSLLNQLGNIQKAESEDPYNSYQENLGKLRKTARGFEQASKQMKSAIDTYLNSREDIGNTQKNDTNQAFAEVLKNRSEVSEALENYLSSTKEMENYLSIDPAADSLAALAPIRQDVKKHGKILKESLNHLASSLVGAGKVMR